MECAWWIYRSAPLGIMSIERYRSTGGTDALSEGDSALYGTVAFRINFYAESWTFMSTPARMYLNTSGKTADVGMNVISVLKALPGFAGNLLYKAGGIG